MKNERLADLAAIKLRGLIGEHLGRGVGEASRLGGGASLRVDGEAWVYFPTVTPGVLGTAVAWSIANPADRVNLIVDEGAGPLAHAASMFATPEPLVWQTSGRRIALAEPHAPTVEPPPECPTLTAELSLAGLDVVADHGVWLGEINGLEVARVGLRDGACSIDIGVGAYDQFASAALNSEIDIADKLATVISMIRPHRTKGAAPHPMGRMVRSRWLRSQLIREPSLLGLDALEPIPLLRPRPGLMEAQPAAALGSRGSKTILVACTVGLDLGVVETAAGLAARQRDVDGGSEVDEVIVVVPRRDHHQRIIDSVAALAIPARVVAIDGEWAD